MKEEGDDMYKQIDERIASKIKADESSKVHEDQNHGEAVANRISR